jgi:glycosyltransferase involved in cell wall biosynthesis
MGTPRVTIVIPTWNRRDLLVEAVASVVAQTCADWELVVVDDGSDDRSIEALHALGEPRLRTIRLERSGNIARLRNVGARSGSGELIAFLDSDDRWLPDKLQRQLAAWRSASAEWAYGAYGHIDAAGEPIARRDGAFRAINGRILRALLAEQTSAYIGTLLVTRRLFEAVGGFDEDLAARADFDFVLRVAAAADAVAVDHELMEVREHASRITHTFGHPHELTAAVFERVLARERSADLRALARTKAARLFTDAAAHRLARGQLGNALPLLLKAFRLRVSPAYAARRIGGGAALWARARDSAVR